MLETPVSSVASTRALLLVAVVATAIGTHLIDRPTTASRILIEMTDPVDEMARAAKWLNDWYAAPEGLQRANGLSIDGHLDYDGLAAWLFNGYLRERLNGANEEEARRRVLEQIRLSDEWRVKHPQTTTTPGR
jgi:hypothetical protein